MHALSLKGLGPTDITFFVKARFEFYQGRYLFVILSGLHQGIDDG